MKLKKVAVSLAIPLIFGLGNPNISKADGDCYDQTVKLVENYEAQAKNQESSYSYDSLDCDMIYDVKKEAVLRTKEESLLEGLLSCMEKNPDYDPSVGIPLGFPQYKSVKDVKEALSKSPARIGETYFKLGIMYRVCGNREKSREYFEKALALAPKQ